MKSITTMGVHRNTDSRTKEEEDLIEEGAITCIFEDYQGVKRGINPRLVRRQGLSKESVDKIIKLHKKAYNILHDAKSGNTPISILSKELEALEFEMQGVWGFTQDSNYHTWWLMMPGCTCPQMDNRDPAYYGRGKIIAGECPVHGG